MPIFKLLVSSMFSFFIVLSSKLPPPKSATKPIGFFIELITPRDPHLASFFGESTSTLTDFLFLKGSIISFPFIVSRIAAVAII